jgi:hypothetical protein
MAGRNILHKTRLRILLTLSEVALLSEESTLILHLAGQLGQ